MSQYPAIIFDAERMKYPHTGIYHYCRQLGNALLNQQQDHFNQLGFYLPPNVMDVFGKDVFKIKQHSLHKFYMPSPRYYKVWHCTYQGTNYYPPAGKHKIAFTIHDLNFLYEKSVAKQKKYLKILQDKVDRADAIIAISAFVKTEIENNLETAGKQVRIIYNGCNIPDNINYSKPNLDISFPFIFTIGAITPKKNFHVLPASIMNNDWHLIIAGVIQNKEYFTKIMEEAAKLGVQHKVHYIGPVSEKEKYWLLQNCALFAFPSLAEGFGLPVVEAMGFGKPLLLSRATSLPEIGGETAVYLDDFTADEVAEKANEALNNFTTEMSEHLKKRSHLFNWKKAAMEYWQVYEELC